MLVRNTNAICNNCGDYYETIAIAFFYCFNVGCFLGM